MARRLNRGEIGLLDVPRSDKRRPVLELSHRRSSTRYTRDCRGGHVHAPRIPDRSAGRPEEGLECVSCVNLCNVFTIPQNQFIVRMAG